MERAMSNNVSRHRDGDPIPAPVRRGQTPRERRSLRTAATSALVMAGAIGFALVIPSTPTGDERTATTSSTTTQTR